MTFILSLIVISNANAWFNTGHMVIAQIAQLILKEEAPEIYQAAMDILTPFKDYCGEDKNVFVEAAVWPDKVKSDGVMQMMAWHFIDNVVRTDGGNSDQNELPIQVSKNTFSPFNITYQIDQSVEALREPNTPRSRGNTDKMLMKSLLLRNLIHFVGDIHQILHSATLYDPKLFPGSDVGGNLFKIHLKGHPDVKNLHAAYDGAFYAFWPNTLLDPLTDDDVQKVEQYAKLIMRKFPRKDLADTDLDYEKGTPLNLWAAESEKFASYWVYPNIVPGETLSDEYIEMASKFCGLRVAQAGYRLVNTLKYALARNGGESELNEGKEGQYSAEIMSLDY